MALMHKRVIDIAGCLGKGVKVELNGSRVPIKTFNDYVGLYLSSSTNLNSEGLPPRFVNFIQYIKSIFFLMKLSFCQKILWQNL